MTKDEMLSKLEKAVSKNRLIHSINVMNTAVKMAERFGANMEKAEIAGLLHDCAKNIKGKEAIALCEELGIEVDEIERIQTGLLHGALGAKLAEMEYKIEDAEILKAILYHTTGREKMGLLEKIIFLSDYIEPGRNFPGVDIIRAQAMNDLDGAILAALDRTITHVIQRKQLLHPRTVNARNYMIRRSMETV